MVSAESACVPPAHRCRGRRCRSRCSRRPAWRQRRSRTLTDATASAPARARHPRPEPPTTSRAGAATKRRSADRRGPGEGTVAPIWARSYRPNSRWRRRPARPPRSLSEGIAGQGIERPDAFLGRVRGRHPAGAERIAQAWSRGRTGPRGSWAGAAGLVAQFQGVIVTGLHLLDRIGRNAAPGLVILQVFHVPRFGRHETLELIADFAALRLPVNSRFDGQAVFLDGGAQRHELGGARLGLRSGGPRRDSEPERERKQQDGGAEHGHANAVARWGDDAIAHNRPAFRRQGGSADPFAIISRPAGPRPIGREPCPRTISAVLAFTSTLPCRTAQPCGCKRRKPITSSTCCGLAPETACSPSTGGTANGAGAFPCRGKKPRSS